MSKNTTESDILNNLLTEVVSEENVSNGIAKINASNGQYYFNAAVAFYRQENYSQSKKILERILDSLNGDRGRLGLLIKSLFLFIEVSIGCCTDVIPIQNKVPQLISFVDGSFRMLDSVYELINHPLNKDNGVNFRSSDDLISQLSAGNVRHFEYHQVVSAILYFQTLLFKCGIYIACLDFLSARKVVHNALEIFKHYLYRVVQSPQVVVVDREEQRGLGLSDFAGPVESTQQRSDSDGFSGQLLQVTEETQRSVAELISGLFRTAIVLSVSVCLTPSPFR